MHSNLQPYCLLSVTMESLRAEAIWSICAVKLKQVSLRISNRFWQMDHAFMKLHIHRFRSTTAAMRSRNVNHKLLKNRRWRRWWWGQWIFRHQDLVQSKFAIGNVKTRHRIEIMGAIKKCGKSSEDERRLDDLEYFGKSIASTVRRMNYWQQAMAKARIEQLMFEIEFGADLDVSTVPVTV